MNILILRSLVLGGIVFLSACSVLSPKAEYIPDNENLKPATVGVSYFFKIKILGGAVIGDSERRIGFVSPDKTGIFLRNCPMEEWRITPKTRDPFDYNCVEIYGTPVKPGVIKIIIGGGMYGSMIAPASAFSKEYTLNVVKP
ncbi:hypothetical protein [Buttiauxella sp.]|uniref:hypothetical protein n=1 Tax=Buttiauxella sp. TaxID=1972222 RepID=UPI003C73F7E4